MRDLGAATNLGDGELSHIVRHGGVPRYFFNVYNDAISLDDEGLDLPDLEAAREPAILGARSLMADALKEGQIVLSHHIAIVGESGELLMDVTFGEAVEVKR